MAVKALWYLLKWACWIGPTSAARSQTGFQSSSVSPVLLTHKVMTRRSCVVFLLLADRQVVKTV